MTDSDERLAFFVHVDVADGERDLITDLETSLGRDLRSSTCARWCTAPRSGIPRPCSKY
ncbi:hypothetical protein OB920_15620 [Halobacteria archaeon HArc-gm2]|nr:hypothetical protein [Halobacteria archaeon HArc-gm2]